MAARSQVPASNGRRADGEARTRYAIAPEDYLAAERRARVEGLEIVGVYHSHPDVAARPSAYDTEHAWPGYRYLIVSVVAGQAREARVFELQPNRDGFNEHDLIIED